jgi:hypothetical protein
VASIQNLKLSLKRDVANVAITIEYDVAFGDFDRRTNLTYIESWRLIGDDTGQDGDDLSAGDDLILGIGSDSSPIAAEGRSVVHRRREMIAAWADLNEDQDLPTAGDDEIRALVTLSPQLPTFKRRESAARHIASP